MTVETDAKHAARYLRKCIKCGAMYDLMSDRFPLCNCPPPSAPTPDKDHLNNIDDSDLEVEFSQ